MIHPDQRPSYGLSEFRSRQHSPPGFESLPQGGYGSPIPKLEQVLSSFGELLRVAEKEEQLQAFLKAHPFVIHPSARVIAKRKLGEDFVTDFVVASTTSAGTHYTLVEIEKQSLPILTRDGSLSHYTRHAFKQTREWDAWLESHKTYLRSKLPGFETPRYLIVIGRSIDLTTSQKLLLRSYNREFATTELLTYDDLVIRLETTIENLRQLSNASLGVTTI